MYADMHLHSTFSDGSDTPKELCDKLIHKGISYCALTDHDTIAGVPHFIKAATGTSLHVIPGIEFSCKEFGRDCHILGYGFSPDNAAINGAVEYSRELRRKNYALRIRHLKDNHGIVFSDEEMHWLESQNSVSRAHIMKLLIKNGYCTSFADGMEKYMNEIKDEEKRFETKDAIEGILAADGVPVWAHPLGGEGEIHKDPLQTMQKIAPFGLQGLECYYSRYTEEESKKLRALAKEYGLLVSGGSDYHGKNKTVPLSLLSADNLDITADKLTVLTVLKDKART